MKRGIDIIGAPLDFGVRELGLKLGPEAFRKAGLLQTAEKVGVDVRDLGDLKISDPDPLRSMEAQARVIAAHCESLAGIVSESILSGRVPVCLGGDHSLAIGSVAGVCAQLRRLGCIWLDTHPDANMPQRSPSGNIHGMPVAVILGTGPEPLLNVGPARAGIAPKNLTLVGIRDVDPGEVDFLERNGVEVFSIFHVFSMGLSEVVDRTVERAADNTNGVHVSFDLDVLDQSTAPGAALASSCGSSMREATYLCRRLASECDIRSVDIVGLNPVRDRGFSTARIAIELLMVLLGHDFSFAYEEYLREQTN